MQSNQTCTVVDNDDKSLSEWPTLSDVCSNAKQTAAQNGGVAKNGRSDPKRTNSPDEEDSAKENDDATRHSNGNNNNRGARKKGSRQKWVPVPIVPPPYRKRYERSGRLYEPGKGGFDEDKKSETPEFENSRNRGGPSTRFRGKRGRGYSSWRPPRQEHRDDADAEIATEKPDADYFPSSMYYDPFTHNQYASVTRKNEVKKAIRNQIEYYFSDENLVKDFFMRRKMDSNGYVPLSLVAGFHRVQSLTMDFQTIVEAISESDKLEVLDGIKVRPVVDPLKWPIQEFYELRPDVPDFIPGQPYFSISSVIESMQNFNFYSEDCQQVSNGIDDGMENYFDNITQNTPVEATS